MSVEKQLKAKSGYGMLVAVAVALIAIIGLFIWSTIGLASTPDGVDAPAVYGWGLGLSILAFCLWFIPLNGFFSLQPGQARVCILFGKYVGTVRDEGFFWANPFFSKSMGGSAGIGEMIELEMSDSKAAKAAAQKAAKGNPTTISTRVRTLNGERLKVNDKMGNPIEIATVVVWHVADTAKALFDVDDYQSYVAMQAETALRHVASVYAYDHLEDESDAAGADAIDEDILRSLRPEIGVIDPFDRNAKQPHQTGRDGFRNQDMPHLHVGEHPRRAAVREEMDGYHRQCGASHRLRHTDEVVER